MRCRGLLVLALVAGCDQLIPKPKEAPKPTPLQQAQAEVATVQAKVDLAIAKADVASIGFAQSHYDGAEGAWQRANEAHNRTDAPGLFDEMEQAQTELDKVIDRAARHRCDR